MGNAKRATNSRTGAQQIFKVIFSVEDLKFG